MRARRQRQSDMYAQLVIESCVYRARCIHSSRYRARYMHSSRSRATRRDKAREHRWRGHSPAGRHRHAPPRPSFSKHPFKAAAARKHPVGRRPCFAGHLTGPDGALWPRRDEDGGRDGGRAFDRDEAPPRPSRLRRSRRASWTPASRGRRRRRRGGTRGRAAGRRRR